MAIGPWQIAIILVLVLLLFGGRGRISSMMGDLAKGIKSFRSGLADDSDDEKPAGATSSLESKPVEPVTTDEKERTKAE
ncbi:twin-arginine translocase TatA/TatE family subunit [Parvularcula lutaonensis]|uniref:Sec-independent protein translocase protein TatA n=1 Tax=Parvularcula lutaonensis TaxID=491923 RepID=A0ABV7MAZ8_9PROT|nr:twin-arginine translocase TatA/TatE family subunit [Parvularcula lutaonensis]GGY39391.1 Sec-independent protein translocase protein TatA [Parvularcula lutaonensis]